MTTPMYAHPSGNRMVRGAPPLDAEAMTGGLLEADDAAAAAETEAADEAAIE